MQEVINKRDLIWDCLFQKRNCYRPFTLDQVQSISYQLCQAVKCKHIIINLLFMEYFLLFIETSHM